MRPKEYVKNVLVTEARDFGPLQERFSKIENIRIMHGILGLASELAEIQLMIAEIPSGTIDVVNLKEEAADCFWYMGVMIDCLGLDPDSILVDADESIIKKIEDPYELAHQLCLFTTFLSIYIGNLTDLVKKSMMYGKSLDIKKVEEELWSINLVLVGMLAQAGLTAAESRIANIAKLKARYGDKFTEAAALERNLANERSILESK